MMDELLFWLEANADDLRSAALIQVRNKKNKLPDHVKSQTSAPDELLARTFHSRWANDPSKLLAAPDNGERLVKAASDLKYVAKSWAREEWKREERETEFIPEMDVATSLGIEPSPQAATINSIVEEVAKDDLPLSWRRTAIRTRVESSDILSDKRVARAILSGDSAYAQFLDVLAFTSAVVWQLNAGELDRDEFTAHQLRIDADPYNVRRCTHCDAVFLAWNGHQKRCEAHRRNPRKESA